VAAVVRRILVLTAEFKELAASSEEAFRLAVIELAVLTGMILTLVGSVAILKGRHPAATPASTAVS
jgi:hypothetical protein